MTRVDRERPPAARPARDRPGRRDRRGVAARRRAARPGRAGHRGRLAAADGRAPRRDLARVMGDPRRAAANAAGGRADDGRRGRAGRRAAGVRGARPRAGHLPARRPADRVGAGVRPDARRADRRDALRGARRHRRGGREAPRRRATVSTLEPCHHRGAVGPMAGVVSPSMWMFELRDDVHGDDGVVLAQRGPGQGAALRRLRPGGHRAAALDDRACSGPSCSQAVRARPGRSTSRRSSPRCCRWATRATTATGPAR